MSKFCTDCRFVQKTGFPVVPEIPRDWRGWGCTEATPRVNPVTGKTDSPGPYGRCVEARGPIGQCGPDGKNFKPAI